MRTWAVRTMRACSWLNVCFLRLCLAYTLVILYKCDWNQPHDPLVMTRQH